MTPRSWSVERLGAERGANFVTSRGLFVDGREPHTTAVIVENATGTEWSVDSWTKAYGQIPDIMTITEWKARS